MTQHSVTMAGPVGMSRYSFRNHSKRFVCPACEREGWFNLNFLGWRDVYCDGVKFTKRSKDERKQSAA